MPQLVKARDITGEAVTFEGTEESAAEVIGWANRHDHEVHRTFKKRAWNDRTPYLCLVDDETEDLYEPGTVLVAVPGLLLGLSREQFEQLYEARA